MINPDEYVSCRNIPVRKTLIAEYKQKHGELVTNPVTLQRLDLALQEFRKRNGKDPVFIADDAGTRFFFEHVPVPISLYFGGFLKNSPTTTGDGLQLDGGEVQIPSAKPIWFAVPKIFSMSV